jgi:hypothetical protein
LIVVGVSTTPGTGKNNLNIQKGERKEKQLWVIPLGAPLTISCVDSGIFNPFCVESKRMFVDKRNAVLG